jgi:GIY-YIG catalytic domain.
LNSNLKDKIPPEMKSDIYQINCKKIYIGKTKRNLETRVQEHFKNIKNGEIEKSAVAAHVRKKNMQWIVNRSY